MKNTNFLVIALRNIDEPDNIEVAGVFTTEEKACLAKAKVIEWMKSNGCKDSEVVLVPFDANNLVWHGINEYI